MLISQDQVPFKFSIDIKENKEIKTGCAFEVKGKDPVNDVIKTLQYHLERRDHISYLDFFERLSFDFGLRLPQNRKRVPDPDFKVNYREVLKKNIDPRIYYGYGDPAVVRVGDEILNKSTAYYLVATSNDAPDSFPILRSDNLKDWKLTGFVFPQGKKPEWAADGEFISDYWAPEMHKIGKEFRIYFVARDKNSLELCVGMAKSLHPEGPYNADKEPILKGNVIDPHIFVQDNEISFLYWKEDNNAVWPGLLIDLLHQNSDLIKILFIEKEDQVTASFIQTIWPWAKNLEPMEQFFIQQILIEAVISMFTSFQVRLLSLIDNQPSHIQQDILKLLKYLKTPVFVQQLSQDGTTLEGEPIKVLENDLEWEAHLVEGIWVSKQNERYYLFYAANDFSTDQYGIGVAIGTSPVGPFKKMAKPFLQSTKQWWAPGHPSVTLGPDGKPQMLLHAYFPGNAGYKQFRSLLSVPLIFKKDKVLVGKLN